MDITVAIGSEEQKKLDRLEETKQSFKLLGSDYLIVNSWHSSNLASPEKTYILKVIK